MNKNRVDRRKQIVPRPAWLGAYPDVHREAVEAAKKSRAREKASVVIQKHIRSHQRKPVVYIFKGRDLSGSAERSGAEWGQIGAAPLGRECAACGGAAPLALGVGVVRVPLSVAQHAPWSGCSCGRW